MSGKSFLVSTSGDRQVLTIPEIEVEHDNGIIECIAENEVGKCSCVASLKIKGTHVMLLSSGARSRLPLRQKCQLRLWDVQMKLI